MDELTEGLLRVLVSDESDLHERLEAATALAESDEEAVAEALLALVISLDGPFDLCVEAAGSLALIWCRNDSFDPKWVEELEDQECLNAIRSVFLHYRSEWIRFLPHWED